MTDEQKDQIIFFGKMQYPIEFILNVLEIENTETFKEDFHRQGSDISILYNIGKDQAVYEIDKMTYELAQSGNLEAIKRYETRRRENERIEAETGFLRKYD